MTLLARVVSAALEATTPAPRDAWREVAAASDEATPYQTPEWTDTACEVSGFEDASRLYELAGGRRLVVPLLVRRRPARALDAAWSMPSNWGFGGIVGPGRIEPSDVAAVLPDLVGAAARTIVKPGPLAAAAWAGVPARRRIPHLVHVVDLRGGFDALWSKRFSSGTRNKLRKAERVGVEVEWGCDERLVRLHGELYRRWTLGRAAERGLPPALALGLARRREPDARVATLARRLGERCRIGVATIGGEAVASTIVLRHGRHALYWRSASDRDRAGRAYPNYLLVARALEDAAAAGVETFHMGESGGVESLMAFKEHFGADRVHYDECRFEPWVADTLGRGGRRALAAALRAAETAARLRR
ncbi:MAG TPA: GNAT family N-acetyltransferase [Gaiellaceae bacterium]